MHVVCSVCCNPFPREFSGVCALKCGHVFHEVCLGRWMKFSETCPTCREGVSFLDVHRVKLDFQVLSGDSGSREKNRALKAMLALASLEIASMEEEQRDMHDIFKFTKTHIEELEVRLATSKQVLEIYKSMVEDITSEIKVSTMQAVYQLAEEFIVLMQKAIQLTNCHEEQQKEIDLLKRDICQLRKQIHDQKSEIRLQEFLMEHLVNEKILMIKNEMMLSANFFTSLEIPFSLEIPDSSFGELSLTGGTDENKEGEGTLVEGTLEDPTFFSKNSLPP